MRSRETICARLCEPGVIAIIRSGRPVPALLLAEALLAGGLTAIELTLTTPRALESVAELHRDLDGRAEIGVGSVLDAAQAREALAAGASFIVSPICREELVAIAHAAGAAIMLGACTPTEAQRAHEAGADFVKLFPADDLGPGFVKALRAPLPHLRIVPTGGVDLHTIPSWMKAGCVAVGAGSSLVSAAGLRDGNWPELTSLARRFVAAMHAARCESV